MTEKRKQPGSEADLFHPIEHAILADYLGLKPPKCAGGIHPDADEELQPEDDESGVVRLRKDLWGDISHFAVHNAVARLLLNSIQYRLPQWGAVNSMGEVQLARDINKRRKEGLSLLPQYLFEINWADSAPGYSWPENISSPSYQGTSDTSSLPQGTARMPTATRISRLGITERTPPWRKVAAG